MKKNLYTTFYIARHGETDWNKNHLLQGQTDTQLNKIGLQQAEDLKERFKNLKFDYIFSSDLKRAAKTAEPLALEHKLAVQTTHLLRERNFGRLEGSHRSELFKFNDVFASLDDKERIRHKMFPEIESDEQLISRTITFFREVAIAYPNTTILVVTHGWVILSLLLHIGYLNYKQLDGSRVRNTGFVKLKTDGVDFKIEEVEGVEKIKLLS